MPDLRHRFEVFTILDMFESFDPMAIPKKIADEAHLFISYKSEKLYVDNAVMLNIVVALIFFLLLYFPSRKINKEKTFLNRPFTDSLRGIAMFMIVMHHLSRVTVNPADLIFYFDLGFIGVGCYLFLSGYGLMESYINKGLPETFLKDRAVRIFIPVLLINTFIHLINHIAVNENMGLLKSTATILGIINTSWFIGFIVFWYLIYYICFKISIADNAKIIILFAVSFVILASNSIDATARMNALSFPCGVLISQYRSKIHDVYESNKEKGFKIVCFVFGLAFISLFILFAGLFIKESPLDQLKPYPSSIFVMQNPLTYFQMRLVLVGVCFLIFMVAFIMQRNRISKKMIVNFTLFSFLLIVSTPSFPRELLQYFVTNSFAVLAVVFIILLTKVILKARSSFFFTLWGKMSLELLLLQGFFINVYLSIPFKLPMQYSIIIFIIFITVISYVFFRISKLIQGRLLPRPSLS